MRRKTPNRRGRYFAVGLLCLLLWGGVFFFSGGKTTQPRRPSANLINLAEPLVDYAIPLDAASAVLMDAQNGQVLFAKNAHKQVPPASLTKMITALVAVQGRELDLPVKISSAAARTSGTRVGLAAGEEIQLGSLVAGMLLRSGNDAAVAVAQGLAGSVEAFSRLMNQQAAELGADSSQFMNPNGLTAEGHLSTAYDLALIAKALLADESLAQIVGCQKTLVPWEGGKREIQNINRFVREYPGALGVKTGYTDEAGFCLAAAAERRGKKLIAIVLGCASSQSRYNDAIRLLEQGFANYRYLSTGKGKANYPAQYHVVRKGQTLSSIARQYKLTEGILAEANKLGPPHRLDVGQILLIP